METQTVVVTGASAGIGRATGHATSQRACTVARILGRATWLRRC